MTELNTTVCETYYYYSSNAQQANKSTERVPDDKQCMSQTAAPNTEQRTPPPAANSASAERRLKRFVDKIKKPRTPPLLQLPPPEQPEATPWPKIPTRSRRIAAQSLSHIPASKREGFLVRKRLGHTEAQAELASTAKPTYDEIFGNNHDHMQALRELFPPEGDIGARKRCRQQTARA